MTFAWNALMEFITFEEFDVRSDLIIQEITNLTRNEIYLINEYNSLIESFINHTYYEDFYQFNLDGRPVDKETVNSILEDTISYYYDTEIEDLYNILNKFNPELTDELQSLLN